VGKSVMISSFHGRGKGKRAEGLFGSLHIA
jgi:hypothetical protein